MQLMDAFYKRYRGWVLLVTLAAIGCVTAIAPVEKTLGVNVRLVYLHGAWVWAGKIAFALASLAGLVHLGQWARGRSTSPDTRREQKFWSGWSLALGRTGLVFWLTYLPLSLYVQQMNWGGIFWDEPRWKVPLAFGVAAVLVQAAVYLFERPLLTSLINLVFGVALWVGLANVQNVLHPDSPIFASGSLRIEGFFVALLLLSLGVLLQVALFFRKIERTG
jgi:hypothetical protein